MRDLGRRTGFDRRRVCITFGRIWGATINRLASSGLRALAIQQEGKWDSGAFVMYSRANRKDYERVSGALARNGKAGGIRPGLGTMNNVWEEEE